MTLIGTGYCTEVSRSSEILLFYYRDVFLLRPTKTLILQPYERGCLMLDTHNIFNPTTTNI
jgi:hypothetical protein